MKKYTYIEHLQKQHKKKIPLKNCKHCQQDVKEMKASILAHPEIWGKQE